MKRKRQASHDSWTFKRQKTDTTSPGGPTWALLRQYYPNVLTLRHYLAARLSKKRRKRLLQYGTNIESTLNTSTVEKVVHLLDSTAVGTLNTIRISDAECIEQDLTVFTQQLSESSASVTPTQGALQQCEIVDFTIWLLFRRNAGSHTPSHILCRGFQKYATVSNEGSDLVAVPGLPGIWSNSANKHVQALKESPWGDLPSLLGKSAQKIITDMLLHCGLFQPVEHSSNLTQLSGAPLCDLKLLSLPAAKDRYIVSNDVKQSTCNIPGAAKRGLSDIQFVRNRMLYASPMLSSKRKVHSGLGHVHVLNRLSDVNIGEQSALVLQYIFPRQFGLHNVFTSNTDYKDTAQPFKDYMIRDQEIAHANHCWKQKKAVHNIGETNKEQPIPKRLRIQAIELVTRLRKRHARCSYASLLNYYCPRPEFTDASNSIGQATSVARVSAFCRNAVWKVFPVDFWGKGTIRSSNQRALMQNIDKFVRLRRYESLALHDVMQFMKVDGIHWLCPSNFDKAAKLSASDFTKRKELMAELIYYVFDSFLIPLIRGHFHVTESGAHRNQLFYFRHDAWKAISEPALSTLKCSMLEERNAVEVKAGMAKRALGISQVRLLPKGQGMRPIINLRRRVQKMQHGQVVLGKSINSILTPAFSILNYEKWARPEVLGSALFSVEDMYPRLQAFRRSLEQQGIAGRPLYFAKVDVKACFDTIPQKRLMSLAKDILGADAYRIAKYARSKLVGGHNAETPGFGAKPSWRYLTKATAGKHDVDFAGEVTSDTAGGRTRTVYVDGVVQKSQRRKAVLELLEEHVESNLIKLGNRFYRQKEGIPQGSIVSSLLCSYFYAELERECLSFVDDGQSVLLRLIDDFLVISPKQHIAEQFVRVMHRGIPEFGVEAKADKSRTNFDIEIGGKVIPRLPSQTDFPYCGNAINTVTLDLSKDKERRRQSNIPDSMTIEYSKLTGQTFYRKTLNALKLQMQAMLLSTAYNSLHTVLSNLHHSFTEVAQKTYHYIRSLPAAKQPASKLVIKTVDDLIKLACVLMKRRKRTSKGILPYECCVSKAQARWLACNAFQTVFQRRQAKHTVLLAWLRQQLATPGLRAQKKELESVVGRR